MNQDLFNRVEAALKTIRPYLEADGGDVELIKITPENGVILELKGACKTCSMSHMTMRAGIEETIMRFCARNSISGSIKACFISYLKSFFEKN